MLYCCVFEFQETDVVDSNRLFLVSHLAYFDQTDMDNILKSRRFLANAQPILNIWLFESGPNDYRVTCIGIQHQLESPLPKAAFSKLE
jgi:hypothetical protein